MQLTVLLDGLLVHEVDAACEKLLSAGIGFKVERVTAADAGVVDSHRNNWATSLGNVMNYFNHGGTGVYMRILVEEADVERAQAALNARKVGSMDRKTLLLWIILGLAVALFVYAFACPRKRQPVIFENVSCVNAPANSAECA